MTSLKPPSTGSISIGLPGLEATPDDDEDGFSGRGVDEICGLDVVLNGGSDVSIAVLSAGSLSACSESSAMCQSRFFFSHAW